MSINRRSNVVRGGQCAGALVREREGRRTLVQAGVGGHGLRESEVYQEGRPGPAMLRFFSIAVSRLA